MKRLLAIFLTGAALLPAEAQLLGPEAINGALLGGLIGGFAGGGNNHCGNNFSGNSAAIGAGIGLAAGALVGAANQRNAYSSQPGNYAPQPYSQPGYGYVNPQPVYAAAPSPSRPNYIVGGTLLGAASGALIGSGNNHQAGQGAAIGAASGLVLGSIAEYAAKKREKKIATANQTLAQPQHQTQPVPQAQPQANENYPKHGPLNTTYYWTKPPAYFYQIKDAPSMPDAPKF